MDTWIIAAYLLVTLALGLFAGAGIGYYAAAREMSMPRYRRRAVAPLPSATAYRMGVNDARKL